MTLHWGSDHIQKCVPPDLYKNLNDICCDPHYDGEGGGLPLYNGKTGEKLFAIPGANPRRVSRRKLRNFLSQGLDVHVCSTSVSLCR